MYIVPVVVVAADVGVGIEPVVSLAVMVLPGLLNFRKAFAGVMVAVDILGVDEPTESWLVTRDKVGVNGLLDCVAPSGCDCDSVIAGAGAAGTGTGGGGGGGGADAGAAADGT